MRAASRPALRAPSMETVATGTPLPVIGVPVKLKSLDGMDSLLSIVQMPAGVPVATVSIDGARNAGLLATRILASADTAEGDRLRAALAEHADELNAQARAKGARLREQMAADR